MLWPAASAAVANMCTQCRKWEIAPPVLVWYDVTVRLCRRRVQHRKRNPGSEESTATYSKGADKGGDEAEGDRARCQ